MDTLLINGDHSTDGRGIPISIDGVREKLQQALIRLGVQKGSFVYDSQFGSELYKLPGAAPANRNRTALAYIREALAPISGIGVKSADCSLTAPDVLEVQVGLVVQGSEYTVAVTVE